jgi:hemerythrin
MNFDFIYKNVLNMVSKQKKIGNDIKKEILPYLEKYAKEHQKYEDLKIIEQLKTKHNVL